MKVLLVAPRSNLNLAQAETQDVLRSGLDVTPIFSPVSQVTLTREIRGGQWDGLWLAGHMDDKGNFPLDNDELVSASALTSLVRSRFEWVYLNTCQSIKTAQMLQNETHAAVICTIADLPDADAYRTGSLFAAALAHLDDARAAYDESRPGANGVYVMLGGGSQNSFFGKPRGVAKATDG